MKENTNRNQFIQKLQDVDNREFAKLITGYGKCSRCSNNYWDGSQARCHKNINNSSCEEGIAQYMESKVGENLQEKYNKKYWVFRSCKQASLGEHLASILYQAGVVEKLEPFCERCIKDDCVSCNWFWCNILDMSRDYVNQFIKQAEKDKDNLYEAHEIERKYYGRGIAFISDILIPRIQSYELAEKAKLLINFLQYG